MCGLFGVVGNTWERNDDDVLKKLGVLSQFRGVHSTGLALYSRMPNKRRKGQRDWFSHIKTDTDSTAFFEFDNVGRVVNSLSAHRAVIGHCRHATLGEVNETNAHPYHIDHIIGAHNGTVDKLGPAKHETHTDSFALYQLMAREGLDEALREAKYGAYALTWFDTTKKTLNLIRNEKRTLFMMQDSKDGLMFWASEKRMLEFIASDSGRTFKEPTPLPINKHYEICLQTMECTVHDKSPTYIPQQWDGERWSANHGRLIPKKDEMLQDACAIVPWNGSSRKGSDNTYDADPSRANVGTKDDVTHINGRCMFHDGSLRVEGIRMCAHDKVDMALDLFTAVKVPKLGLPMTIVNSNSNKAKHLRFMGYGGEVMTIPHAISLLRKGCAYTLDVPKLTDDIIWISPSEFVIGEHIKDVMQYVGENQDVTVGALVYAPYLYKPKEVKPTCH